MSLVETFVANAQTAGFVVHRGQQPAIPDAGVSEAAWGVADTGSVVLSASRDEPRARSLLPEVHISLLREDLIVADLAELFARVGELPSSLAIVTGPSRTADIEQTIVIGAHGPREVHVVLLPQAD